MVNGDEIPMVRTTHEIGLVTAAKLVAICWAGIVPIVFPAWLIVKAEITAEIQAHADRAAEKYFTIKDHDAFKGALDDRFMEIQKRLEIMDKNQRRIMTKLGIVEK
jgi:hypothetical protein